MENQTTPTSRAPGDADSPVQAHAESPARSTYMSRLVGISQRVNTTIRRLEYAPEEQQGLAAQLSASFSRRHESRNTTAPRAASQNHGQGGRGRRTTDFIFRLVCLRRPERSSCNISYQELQEYGLGSASTSNERGFLSISVTATEADMRALIEEAFPVLRSTPYEARRSERGGRLSPLGSLTPADIRDVFLAGRIRLPNPPTIFIAPSEEIHHRPMDTPTVLGRVTPRTGSTTPTPHIQDQPLSLPNQAQDPPERTGSPIQPDTPLLPDLTGSPDRPETPIQTEPLAMQPETGSPIRPETPLLPDLTSTPMQPEQTTTQLQHERPISPIQPDLLTTPNLPPFEPEGNRTNIFIRRQAVVEDMTAAFEDDNLVTTGVRVEILGESAVDVNGVLRDILTEFWTDLTNSGAFEGSDQGAPRPNGQTTANTWRAIGNILVLGWRQVRYIPIRFALASLIWGVFGHVTELLLLSSWVQSLESYERPTIQSVLDNGLIEDMNMVVDVLDRFRITTLPTAANVRRLIVRAAHVHLVEAAAYPLMQMRLDRLRPAFASPRELVDRRVQLLPDGNRVAEMLVADITNQRQQEIYDHLCRCVRSMDSATLRNFVRFVSGSDALTFRQITIQFVRVSGLERRFVAHTCGVVLDVPTTYAAFNEMNRELTSQLSSGQWEMNFL